MKLLIISLPRTGSSSLLFDLAEKHKLKPLFEPFDGSNRYTYDKNEDNIVVKTLIHQYNDNVGLSKNFDSVILLTRRDLISCAESYSYFCKNRKKGFESYYPYFYEDITDDEFNNILNILKNYNEQLQILSNKLNIPLTYYEDIYDINSDHRLRKFKKEDIIKTKII